MATSARSENSKRLTMLNYALAAVSAVTSGLLVFTLYPWWRINSALLFFLTVVLFVALVSGPGPAALASLLAILCFGYLLTPGYAFALHLGELMPVMLFIVASIFVVTLSAAHRRALASFQSARTRHQITVRELQEQNDSLRAQNAERGEAAERSQWAEQEIRLTVDTVPALIARYRADGVMDFRNKNWREYTGLSQDNVEGRRWGSALHPDDQEMVETTWREHIATGQPFDLEQRLRRADGEYRWHRVRRVPLHDETGEVVKWYAIAFDIDDRKRTEDALRTSEAALAKTRHELQLMIDTIPVLVLRHRADGIIDFVNEVGRTYSGLTTTKWTTRTSIITHPDDVPRLEAAWDAAISTGEPFESELRLRRADGEYRWFVSRRVPLRRNGELIAWYAATYDIEDRKRAESELIESERRFREAQMELAHASRVVTMGQLTASIAHEVNQPLAALITNAETAMRWLTRKPRNFDKAKPLIERVISDGRRAADVVSRIRNFSKKAPMRKERLEVNEAILDVMALTRAALSDNGVSAQMQLAKDLPPIMGDKVQLQQVILNLIMNAIEAMSEGGTDSRDLSISTSMTERDDLVVAVRDSGPGLPPANLERVFEPFYTTKSTGLGMGLSICRSIIEAHGGQLWPTQNEPHGAVFCMTLPIRDRSPVNQAPGHP